MSNPPLIRRITDITPVEDSIRNGHREALDPLRVEQCKECPKPVWFTAFFDGTGNNYGEDGNGSTDVAKTKYSNIAKLAMFAHVPFNKANPRTMGRYVEGVGTPCSKVGDSGKGIDGALGMAAASKGEARIRWLLREGLLRLFDEADTVANGSVSFITSNPSPTPLPTPTPAPQP